MRYLLIPYCFRGLPTPAPLEPEAASMPEPLTGPERTLWAAFRTGTPVDLRTGDPAKDDPAGAAGWGPERTVRGEFVAGLLLGARTPAPGHVAAVRLTGARITGRIDVTGGTVDYELRLSWCRLDEAPSFANAQTRQIRMSDCRLPGLDGGGLRADGYLSLSCSVIDGEVRLPRAQLTGGFRMNATKISNPGGWALFSGALIVEAGTFARGAEFTGGVRLVGARLGGGLFMEGSTLRNPGGDALTADNMIVEDAMECAKGFTAEGSVRLRGVRINGTLSFHGAALRTEAGRRALHLSHAQVDELILIPREPVRGEVSLVYSRVGVLLDRQACWPARLRLNGLTYESLRGGGREQRLDWISRDPNGFRQQPYEELASWYRRTGHDDLARKTQLARQRARRGTLGFAGRLWGYLLDWIVGYGYRPWIAGVWFGLLLAGGAAVFAEQPPRALREPAQQPHFNPLIYTFDLLVPIGAFGQRDAWDPVGWTQWLAYGLIVAGWILATALLAGATRVLRPSR